MNYTQDKLSFYLENKFGKVFTKNYSEINNYIIELVEQNKLTLDEAFKSLLYGYLEYRIDIASLKGLLKYMDYNLPPLFVALADKVRQLIHELAGKVSSEYELLNLLLFYYQNNRINESELEIAYLLLGYELSPEFKSLSKEQKKTRQWIYDCNNLPLLLSDSATKIMRCCQGLKEFDTSEFLIPKMEYRNSMHFVLDYMQQNNIDDKVLSEAGLDRRKKHRLISDGIKNKLDCYRFIFILKMNPTIATQFMTLCGYCFSPLDDVDMFFLDYLSGKYGTVDTLFDLTTLSMDYCNVDFEFNILN